MDPAIKTAFHVIINPNAGRRIGMRDWPEIAHLLDASDIPFTYAFTHGPSDAMDIAVKVLEEGYRKIIVVGGDGTLNETVNGIFSQSLIPAVEVTLAMIPIGTGNDWGKTYGFPSDYSSAVEMIRNGHTVIQDVGIVAFTSNSVRRERYFINVAGLGCDAIVTFDTNRRKEKGGSGKVAYMVSLMKSLLKYSYDEAEVLADGEMLFSGKLYSANIGICRYNGGGMMQVPYALPDDGLFDITLFRKMSKLTVIRNAGRLYDGSFVKIRQVSTHRASKILVRSGEPVLLEADGESLGTAPFEFKLLPKALKFIVPKPAAENKT